MPEESTGSTLGVALAREREKMNVVAPFYRNKNTLVHMVIKPVVRGLLVALAR